MSNTRQLSTTQLDPEQLAAVTAPRGPVCIVAGAGTGKTRTITHRIEYLVRGGYVNPSQVLAVSFTKRSAAELRERLVLLNMGQVQAVTFHSAAARQLRHFWPAYAGNTEYRFISGREEYQVLRAALRLANSKANQDSLADLLNEISWAKSRLIVPEDYPAHVGPARRDCPVDPHEFVRIFRAYEHIKLNGSAGPDGGAILLDFADQLIHAAGAIESNPAIAAEFRSRYRTFIVDEYQDTNPLQQRLLEAWLGDRDDLTVVGDANQTIFSFTGATPDYLLGFTRSFPDATVVGLHRDYRSTPQVVDLANSVIAKATGRTTNASIKGVKLEGQRDNGPEPTFTEYPDSIEEATGVAHEIRSLIDQGVPAHEIAILVRVNEQAENFAHALDQAGIGYELRGGETFFNRSEVRAGLGAVTKAFLTHQPEPANIIAATRNALTPLGLLPEGLDDDGGADSTEIEPGAAKRHHSLQALLDLVQDMHAHTNGAITAPEVLRLLEERRSSANPPDFNGVTISTIHAAKGLEWDAVFIVGAEERNLPFFRALKGANSAEAIEEERRLLYVAVTRAREHLHLSWALSRSQGGQAKRKRTRFLDGLVPWEKNTDATLPLGAGASRNAGSRSGKTRGSKTRSDILCQECGTRLDVAELRILGLCHDHVPELDRTLVADLRSWRTDTARSRGVPPYVIFTDATLAAIATHRPTTAPQMMKIPGIGPMKLQEFGEDVLGILANYV